MAQNRLIGLNDRQNMEKCSKTALKLVTLKVRTRKQVKSLIKRGNPLARNTVLKLIQNYFLSSDRNCYSCCTTIKPFSLVLSLKSSVIQTELDIELLSNRNVFKRNYRFRPEDADIAQRQIDDMLETGVIEKATCFDLNSSIFIVAQKDNSKRLVVDLRELNAVIVPKFINARCDASAVFAVMQCPSVRLSRSWITSKRIHISTIFLQSGSDTIIVFQYQRWCRYSAGNPPNGGVECKEGL